MTHLLKILRVSMISLKATKFSILQLNLKIGFSNFAAESAGWYSKYKFLASGKAYDQNPQVNSKERPIMRYLSLPEEVSKNQM